VPDTIAHYRLLNKIGSGGMGAVYRAVDTRTGATVAVKVLHQHLADDPEYIKRFRREAQIAASLDSPHIVRVLEAGQEGERHFLVMEYAEGRNLAQVLGDEGPLRSA
jgi:serine/threonine-protein kinase